MKTWIYLVEGKEKSCLEHELVQKKATGEIGDNTYVWTEGMMEWSLFSEIQAGLTSNLQQSVTNSDVTSQKDMQIRETKSVAFPDVKPIIFWKFILGFSGIIFLFISSFFSESGLAVIMLMLVIPFLACIYMLYCDVIRQMWIIVNAISVDRAPRSPSVMVLLGIIPGINIIGNFIVFPGIARRWEAFRLTCSDKGIPEFKEEYSWICAISVPSTIFLGICGGVALWNILNIAIIIMFLVMISRMCKIINFVAKQSAKK